jgi:hypothetical protein
MLQRKHALIEALRVLRPRIVEFTVVGGEASGCNMTSEHSSLLRTDRRFVDAPASLQSKILQDMRLSQACSSVREAPTCYEIHLRRQLQTAANNRFEEIIVTLNFH